jgi:hypothetical protein
VVPITLTLQRRSATSKQRSLVVVRVTQGYYS